MTTITASTISDDTLHLDQLSSMQVDELDSLYRQGTLPSSFNTLNGTPKGRMLAIRTLDQTPLFGPISLLSKAKVFPWEGKSFNATSDCTGTGINRINLTLLKQQWFPFNTRVEPSVIDGKDCIYLDYDLPENPWFVRKIRDELREVSPGLFLGPAMWKTGDNEAALVLWFAIDTTQ
ncbi:hypothetical protein [Ketobacter alkanivorans]|uniref:Uncharacterized protein n=1 Tax=Ketobacter alkanivorans TaxID=1917421 RepID=A0A2K9LP75_9GAMM|nr:hypothetical protein [Ketobacter alkanivorans]AUM14138.1 hypothetical protein Kalk_17660 [Ketobacter alkanivorans]MCP5018678.1 hypothetical protein [Ketobacter sp.]